MGRSPCKICKEVWNSQGEDPPCYKCFPGVHQFNQTAYVIYERGIGEYEYVKQGIPITPLNIVFDWFGIKKKERAELSEQIDLISLGITEKLKEEQKKQEALRKLKGKGI